MQQIATLIADPVRPVLSAERAEDARAALADAGAEPGEPDWLSAAEACDLPFDGETEAAYRALRAQCKDLPVDVVVQPAEHRRKKLLVADMESTIIVNEMVDELANMLGIGPKVADITRRAMNGEIGFRPALKERVALLGGLEEEALKSTRKLIRFTPGALTLVRTMRANGAVAALVSGGFEVYCKWVRKRARFDYIYANRLIVHDGVVTGELEEPIMGREDKRKAMETVAAKHGIELADCLAVGDGANDLEMLGKAGLGVAFHAKPAVAAATDARIDHGDLTALLFLQGYRREAFVTEAD